MSSTPPPPEYPPPPASGPSPGYPPPPGYGPSPSYPTPRYGPPPPYASADTPPGKVRLRGHAPRLIGWIFLGLAVVLFVVGGVVLATKSFGKVDGFQRVSVAAGGGTVTLDGAGKWIGYYEASNVTDSISRIPDIRVAMTDPSGRPVKLETYGNRSDGTIKRLTYQYDGHDGVAAIQFEAAQPGTYQVQIESLETLPAGADIAFGRDIGTGTAVGSVLIVLGVLALITAIVLLIVGFVKRGRHKRELQSGYYGGAPLGYGAPPGYGPSHGSGPPAYPNPPPPSSY